MREPTRTARRAANRAAKKQSAPLIVALKGSVAIAGAPTGRLPVRYKGELLADAGGVPLLRGGRASVYDGRFDLNLLGVIADSCLSSNSLRPVFAGSPGLGGADGGPGLLRVSKSRRVALDIEAFVSPELVGYGCNAGDRPLGEVVTLQFRGTLRKRSLASIPLTARTPVTLAGGRQGTLTVTATAAVRRLTSAAKR